VLPVNSARSGAVVRLERSESCFPRLCPPARTRPSQEDQYQTKTAPRDGPVIESWFNESDVFRETAVAMTPCRPPITTLWRKVQLRVPL
jgi:hypothetical protein